ncbi:MAG: DUF389 domain-containing protein, partial [Gammaproteobacteria bacterium]
MSVLALISDKQAIDVVLPWATSFAKARETSLKVVCWIFSPIVDGEGDEALREDLVLAAQEFFERAETDPPPEVVCVSGPSDAAAVIEIARKEEAELIVAAAKDRLGVKGATYATNPLLKQSPCNTVVLFGDSARSTKPKRILVGATDNVHDGSALSLASRLGNNCKSRVTLARAELEGKQEGEEVGRRELKRLMREVGVKKGDRLKLEVFHTGAVNEIAEAMDQQDLVLLGMNTSHVPQILELTSNPTVAVIKRAPPLRPWQTAKGLANWIPRLSPADYAELIQGLRHGSRLSADFVTMLSLATVVASIGLLQNSPAVVIGSMLLAPLMTPMIGCGLALAQANRTLGYTALGTVAVGLLCTLSISLLIGLVAPGVELTPQIYARGAPTLLDLGVAVASAAAAAYALARPNLVGSIAGVAIAKALVPPLCSVGLSLAYGDVTNAEGAALLFVTNFLAIVLGAAATFRLIGITAEHADVREKFWVARIVGIFGIAIILVCIPLQHALIR